MLVFMRYLNLYYWYIVIYDSITIFHPLQYDKYLRMCIGSLVVLIFCLLQTVSWLQEAAVKKVVQVSSLLKDIYDVISITMWGQPWHNSTALDSR